MPTPFMPIQTIPPRYRRRIRRPSAMHSTPNASIGSGIPVPGTRPWPTAAMPPGGFYKPQGNVNQHPGYASVAEGDAHIADVVAKLRAGPQWPHMVVVITYDEFGGAWDHVPPPNGDLLGPGARIPALIISPFAKRGTVDHTPYDTGSIQRLITRRFDLDALPGITARDQALAAHGAPPMGDLTNSLELRRGGLKAACRSAAVHRVSLPSVPGRGLPQLQHSA